MRDTAYKIHPRPVVVLSFFIWFFKVQMGRMQPVVMALKNPFLPFSAPPPLSYLLQYVGLAGIRTHDLQQLNQAASHTTIMPAPNTYTARLLLRDDTRH